MNKSNSQKKNYVLVIIIAIAIFCFLHGIFNSSKTEPKVKVAKAADGFQSSASDYIWNGEQLTPAKGTIQGPSGKETFYNMDMSYVIEIMHANDKLGRYENYQYWIREDGCKMFGDYIMVAADLRYRPKGTIVDTSLGKGIVVDTGLFVYMYTYYDKETGENIIVPSYVTDPKNSSERIYDPEAYIPDEENHCYPPSTQLDIATTWEPQR
ncbi:MAG: hypothetical protein K6B70_06360 [Clostridia bacterium]|nr:hypothetical protein [Clostridia bacterium]